LLDGGQVVEYRRLCLCMGARALRPDLPGGGLGHVCVCRNAADEERINKLISGARQRVVVFGGGGLAASFLTRLLEDQPQGHGDRLTVLHRRSHFWGRWLDPEGADWLTQRIAARGVELRMHEEVKGWEGRLMLRNVQTKSGQRFAAGLGLVAWGTQPRLELVQGTPLGYPQGIPVDEFLETEEKGVFAVGEVAACPPGAGRRVDIAEGILRQAEVAAWNITGRERRRFEWVYRRKTEFLGMQFEFVGDCDLPVRRIEREGKPGEGFILRRYGDRGVVGVVLCDQPEEVAKGVVAELSRGVRRSRESNLV
jgi:NAD(P)H-nitrite reductase large subunit